MLRRNQLGLPESLSNKYFPLEEYSKGSKSLIAEAARVGLVINKKKTKVMTFGIDQASSNPFGSRGDLGLLGFFIGKGKLGLIKVDYWVLGLVGWLLVIGDWGLGMKGQQWGFEQEYPSRSTIIAKHYRLTSTNRTNKYSLIFIIMINIKYSVGLTVIVNLVLVGNHIKLICWILDLKRLLLLLALCFLEKVFLFLLIVSIDTYLLIVQYLFIGSIV